MSKTTWDIILPGIVVFLYDKFIYDMLIYLYKKCYYCIGGFNGTEQICRFWFDLPSTPILMMILITIGIIITYYYLKNSYNTLEAIGREHYFNRK